jgi:hypothetical protein
MTITTIAIIIAALFLLGVIVKTLWNSKLFWFAALALSIVLMPLTAGLSPVALFLLLLVRFALVHKALTAGGAR